MCHRAVTCDTRVCTHGCHHHGYSRHATRRVKASALICWFLEHWSGPSTSLSLLLQNTSCSECCAVASPDYRHAAATTPLSCVRRQFVSIAIASSWTALPKPVPPPQTRPDHLVLCMPVSQHQRPARFPLDRQRMRRESTQRADRLCILPAARGCSIT